MGKALGHIQPHPKLGGDVLKTHAVPLSTVALEPFGIGKPEPVQPGKKS